MSGVLALLRPDPPPPPPPGPDGKPPPAPSSPTPRALLGLFGVLLAALSSYLNQYDTNFARADLYGGLNLGQDEGLWVTVGFDCGSVAIVVLTAWLSTIFTPRRIVAFFLVVQLLAAVTVPRMTGYPGLMTMAFLHGVGGGALVPMLFTTLLRVLPPNAGRLWGFAAYAMVVCLSPLTGEIIGGYFKEYLGWQTIFWTCLVLNPIALVLVMAGLPVEKVKLEGFTKGADYFGMMFFTGFACTLTAALVVGQQYDWFSSTLVDTLFVLAAIFLVLFVWEELSVEHPLIELRLLKRRNLSLGLLIIVMFFFALQGAAYILPQYGAQIRDFRELQIGVILLWATIPILVLSPLTAWVLHYVDARVVAAVGFLLVVIADRLATYLTSDWVEAEFLTSQIIAACGYPLVLISLLLCVTSVLQPQDAISGSTLFNVIRVLAGNFGGAIMGGIVTVRQRVHSNIIASDAVTGAFGTVQREREAGGLSGLSSEVHRQAYVMAYADAYGWIAMIMIAGIVVLLFVGPAAVARRPKKEPKGAERTPGPEPQPAE
ncbi:MAG: MFS transporter [Acetobacteraceae bacterium]|nr:MFS transporter [Acetobacteraceae bacterium]